MTHDDVLALMEAIRAATGCSYAYDHFAKGKARTRLLYVSSIPRRQSSGRIISSTTASAIWISRCTPT